VTANNAISCNEVSCNLDMPSISDVKCAAIFVFLRLSIRRYWELMTQMWLTNNRP